MKRVRRDDIAAGMITAERITDARHNVLLEANMEITPSHAGILRTWNIEFIRVREESDTDQSLREQLKADRQAEEEQSKEKLKEKRVSIRADLGITMDNIVSMMSGNGDKHLYSDGRETALSGKAVKIGSILNVEALDTYVGIMAEVDKLFGGDVRERDLFLRDCNLLAVRLNDYVTKTVAVVGYCLYPHKMQADPLAAHTVRTAVLAGKLAKLLGLSEKDVKIVIVSALLHDVGCLFLPEEIRKRKKVFSAEETAIYQGHVLKGIEMLKDKRYFPREVLLAVGGHHEHMDGSGYPLKIKAEKIHVYARILGLANAVDNAMYPFAPEEEGKKLPAIIDELPFWSKLFDSNMCLVFREYLKDFILSNRVTLGDGRRAEIIWSHYAFKEPVIRTSDGDIIDLNKALGLNIDSYSL